MPKRDATRSMSLTSQESYSAVIIADMVAEVRTDPADDRTDPTPSFEQTNPTFDPNLSPAVVDVEMMETNVSNGNQRNGRISRGVVLSATQFGVAEKSIGDPLKMDGITSKQVKEQPTGSKTMSFGRKVAFVFSFLPSVMFVLCFAVILPCKEPVPCLREAWTNSLGNVVVPTRVALSGEHVIYTSTASGNNSVSGASQASGAVTWTTDRLESNARFLQCGHLESKDSESCMLVESKGRLLLFNASNGDVRRDVFHSLPLSTVVLPDCNGDGLSEVVLSDRTGELRVLMGDVTLTVNVTGCESVPSDLTPWWTGNETSLLLSCTHGESEKLMKIPQSQWCSSPKESSKEDILTLGSWAVGTLARSLLLPADDGLVLWIDSDVSMFESDGQRRWKVSSLPHSKNNRFLLYGKFNETHEQVALFSSNNLWVSTLSALTGEKTWSKGEPNLEISDVTLIHGKNKDFAVVSVRKGKPSLASEALQTIGALSTTIASVLSKEDLPSNDSQAPTGRMTGGVSFLEFGDKFLHPVEERELSHAEAVFSKTSITVVPNDDEAADTLSMLILSTPSRASDAKVMTSQLRRIDVANWDISLNKESHCKWRP